MENSLKSTYPLANRDWDLLSFDSVDELRALVVEELDTS